MGSSLLSRPSSPIRIRKVRKIFQKFDFNNDGHLNRDEMSAFMVAVNPTLSFNEEHIDAILEEIFRTYGDYIEPELGLCFDGLLQTYDDGAGDIDRDFNALGLELDKNAKVSTKKSIEETREGGENVSSSSSVATRTPPGSWAISPRNGIIYDDTWALIEEVEMLVRKLEMKTESRVKGSQKQDLSSSFCGNNENDGNHGGRMSNCGPIHGVNIMSSCGPMHGVNIMSSCGPMCMAGGKMPLCKGWGPPDSMTSESGQDYAHFQKGMDELRKKADQSRTQDEAFDAHMAIGRTLFDHKLYKEALVSFERARGLKPIDLRPLFQQGNCFYSLGKMPEAIKSYTLGLNTGETDAGRWRSLLPQIHVNLGIALEADGMLLSACEHYKEAAIKEPRHYRALKLLGSALYGLGEYNAAKEALVESILLHPDYADAHCELGSVLHSLGDHNAAISEYNKALELKGDHVEALYNLATLLKDIKQYRKACDAYSKVLDLDPTNWRAQINKAVSLLGGGDIAEARRAFKKAYRMTGRSEVYDAMVHVRSKGKKPKDVPDSVMKPISVDLVERSSDGNAPLEAESSGSKPGIGNSTISQELQTHVLDLDSGDRSRGGSSFIEVKPSCFQRANANTTPRELLMYALDIREFQRCTRLNRCNVANLIRELNQFLLPMLNSRVGISEKLIRKEALEKVIKRLLRFLKPEAFQGAMKAINERVLAALDVSGSGKVDLGMTFAVLALVCSGSLEKRKHTAFDALVYRSSQTMDGEISKQDARKFLRVLQACYRHSSAVESNLCHSGDGSAVEESRDRYVSLSFPEFVEMLDDPDRGFGVLSVLEKLEKEVSSRKTCSVCSYPVSGPWFKETGSSFILCSLCYSSGRVPLSSARDGKLYFFKEYNGELEVVKDRLNLYCVEACKRTSKNS